MYKDLRVHVWSNNYYGILATNVNPVTVPCSGAVTESTGLDALPKLQPVAKIKILIKNKVDK